jgi:hypothetical protein
LRGGTGNDSLFGMQVLSTPNPSKVDFLLRVTDGPAG